MKKANQQSRTGWGGRRAGAGAPLGNANAVKHGERSRRALFMPAGCEDMPQLVALRAGSLIIAERYGEIKQGDLRDPEVWREMMLMDGIMWQRTRRIAAIELTQVKDALRRARLIPLRRTHKSAQ